MTESYLFSVINLYLNNENKDNKISMTIEKENSIINFSLKMTNNVDSTKFFLPIEVVNTCLEKTLLSYKGNSIIIDEKYECDKVDKTCYYSVLFNNGRRASFNNFTIKEINVIRNYLYNIQINKEEIRVKENVPAPKVAFKLQYAGFTSIKTLFFVTLFFLDIFIVSLWICKAFLK